MTAPFNPFGNQPAEPRVVHENVVADTIQASSVIGTENPSLPATQNTQSTSVSINPESFHFNEQNITQIGQKIVERFTAVNGNLSTQMKAADFDSFSGQLSGLLAKTRSINPSALTNAGNKPKNFISSMKAFFVDVKDSVMREFQTVKDQVDQIVINLDAVSKSQENMIVHMENVYQDNHALHQELEKEVARVTAMLAADREKLALLDVKSMSVMDVQLYNDQANRFERVESKLAEMTMVMRICEQNAPEIRQYQDNARMLVGKFHSFKTYGLLLWQRQFDKAVANLRQKKAIEVARATADFTNEMLLNNSQMMRDNTIAAGVESRRGLVDIDTYEKANENLIGMLQDVITNVGAAKAAREDAQKRMQAANSKLLDTMQQLDSARAAQYVQQTTSTTITQ